jgi:hypothetical protein
VMSARMHYIGERHLLLAIDRKVLPMSGSFGS